MIQLTYIILAAFCLAAVSGNPRFNPGHGHENENGFNYREVYPTGGPEIECYAIIKREKCSGIVEDAFSKFRRFKDLRYSFQHYCRTIPDLVPCLEANKADYMKLIQCDRHMEDVLNQIMTAADVSLDELWDMKVDFLDTVNDIICSRTEELLDLIECIKKNDRSMEPKLDICNSEHGPPFPILVSRFVRSEEPFNESMLCGSTIGFGGCFKDALAEVCEDSTALLNTIYDDVIVGVIGNGFGCEPPTNPLLSFVRSVRDNLRR